jgi:integrase/recombinase XerD
MNPAWEDALEGCLGYLATEKSHAVNTQLINRLALESFVAWMEKNHPDRLPGTLTGDDIRGFLRAQRTERRLAPASMKMVIVALRHLFAHLKREGLIRHDLLPALDIPRLDRYLPETLSESEVDRLLAVGLPETPLGLRDRALLEVLYASGLRAGEIAGLRLENFYGSSARAIANGWCQWAKKRWRPSTAGLPWAGPNW